VLDQPIARGEEFFAPDHLGSTAMLFDGAGLVTQRYDYLPFGERVTSNGTNPITFTGREDDGVGLMYNRARYYAPGWGRFISEDPIGFGGGINQYAYCENNPLNLIDPLGLAATTGTPPPLPPFDPWGKPYTPAETPYWHLADAYHTDHYDITLRIGSQTRAYRVYPLPDGTWKWDEKSSSLRSRLAQLVRARNVWWSRQRKKGSGGAARPRGNPRPGIRGGGRPWPRPTGSGGGANALVTIGYAAGALADGLQNVIRYGKRVNLYGDPDADWEGDHWWVPR
jgi:RHS repeat-associated protein